MAATGRLQHPPTASVAWPSTRSHLTPTRQLRAAHRGRRPAAASELVLAVAPICFTQECQSQADQAFVLGLAIPMCLAVAAAAYVARPPPRELKDSGSVFEDDSTGFMFAKEEGEAEPERDKDVSIPLPLPVSSFPSADAMCAPCADWPSAVSNVCFNRGCSPSGPSATHLGLCPPTMRGSG